MQFSLKQLRYTLQMNIIHFIQDYIKDPIAWVKLQYLKHKTGGDLNKAKPEEIDDYLGGREGIRELGRYILATSALTDICNRFGLEVTDTTAAVAIVHQSMGKIEDVEMAEHIEKVVHSNPRRKAIFDLMWDFGDIKPSHIDLLKATGKFNEFKIWLEVKNDDDLSEVK